MLRYLTAGESHGPQLTAIIEGMPSGIPLEAETINRELARRQMGYGRGGRMQIERDTVEILSGVRWGRTLASPLTLVVKNRDWENWSLKMSPSSEHRDDSLAVTRPRPGHADLSGALKYDHDDVRNILERSSARETAVRVAVGAAAKALLQPFGIRVGGIVSEVGGVSAPRPDLPPAELWERAAASEMFCCDAAAEQEMKRAIDAAKACGDTLGGVVEVQVIGVPPGLGSYVQWDRKLDARLAMALMSIQAIKGVEVGMGFGTAHIPGSLVHDELFRDAGRLEQGAATAYYRTTNNAGGIEGGMSNGEPIVLRAAMKPIPTLYKPLRSVDMRTHEAFEAAVERSDTCAVPAALVVAEAVVAIEIANAFLEKFGGDSLGEIEHNYAGYLERIRMA
ncbi:chorismate synthase [Geobacter sp. SVR]|uniref:chorismate synthase n=1 Tax=Geobacter sp. SVR TaxID=2495594 RepID=UPI00143F0369|nr:chorismate synthase [Geobacter sp. SVR]BCS54282.1 chorismate synthase [Geobacter sp. SVR]GCF85859.1 chorismate synthase [Geobacter sp. SVR]